jgi:hypothetical protein
LPIPILRNNDATPLLGSSLLSPSPRHLGSSLLRRFLDRGGFAFALRLGCRGLGVVLVSVRVRVAGFGGWREVVVVVIFVRIVCHPRSFLPSLFDRSSLFFIHLVLLIQPLLAVSILRFLFTLHDLLLLLLGLLRDGCSDLAISSGLFSAKMGDDVFERAVFLHELVGGGGSDTLDGFEVVAAHEDTELDELGDGSGGKEKSWR